MPMPRPIVRTVRAKYLLVGHFVPFGREEALARYEREARDMQLAGIEGPVDLETTTAENASPFYLVEVMPGSVMIDTVPALTRKLNRIQSDHKIKAVYRIHADRAQELIGARMAEIFEGRGLMVTSTGCRFQCQWTR